MTLKILISDKEEKRQYGECNLRGRYNIKSQSVYFELNKEESTW